jgi:hypothetical protein
MGALTSLNMSANGLKGAAAGKALGDALAANTVLKELDLSGGKDMDIAFVKAFTPGLSDNGALQCTDGIPYLPEKSFMMSTRVCRHCGQHETQHTSR